MRNTLRIVLAVFLIVLVAANYNSVRIVKIAVNALNDDLQQRTNLIQRELIVKVSENYTALDQNPGEFDRQLRKWMDIYDIEGALLFSDTGQSEKILLNDLPQNLVTTASCTEAASKSGVR